ncbi:hypothetical protein [Parvibaculum sp.]|uniref:hypothetical protein n=1 Tax=Parvibaculum sp. TaxID=2024848 RepID=UPI00262CB3E5|nr:hypothetical protein [Parvibaculum sp.]MCW5726234.1 hypothetical protein [Parvibaculum sp.]
MPIPAGANICAPGKLAPLPGIAGSGETVPMNPDNSNRKPGDLIIDRYMPNATEAERKEARENLHAYLAVVMRIAARLEREERERGQAIRVNPNSAVDSGHTPSI